MWPMKLGKQFSITSYQININQNSNELEVRYISVYI